MANGLSLKTRNVLQIWTVLSCDAAVIAALVSPSLLDDMSLSSLGLSRIASAALAPIVVFFLSSLVTPQTKAILVFWRLSNALPGHRAFSIYAASDPRIDIERLRRNVGEFPDLPKDQNALWYQLYRKIHEDVSVSSSNRQFLLFRDIASISVLLAIIVPAVLYALRISLTNIGLAELIFGVQYLAARFAARNHGESLVKNVLALHSIKKVQ